MLSAHFSYLALTLTLNIIITGSSPMPSPDCFEDICQSVSDYPKAQVEAALAKLPQLKQVFASVSRSLRRHKRRIFDDADKNFCSTKSTLIYPKYIVNEFVVQSVDIRQMVEIDVCQNERPHLDVAVGYEFECKQKLTDVRLLIITKNGTLEFGTFKMPTACVLTYSK